MKKRVIIGLGAVIVLALGLWWWFARDRAGDGSLVLQGNVDVRQVSLAFNATGRVAEVRVEEGSHVNIGDVLATLDTQSLGYQAAQAKAQIEVQQQNAARLHNGARPEEIGQARSQLSAAQADSVRAGQDLERLEKVSTATQGRGVSAAEMDRARSAAKVATENAQGRRDALTLAEQGPRKEEIAAAEAQLDASRAQLALLEYQISQGELKAPVDAVVRSRLVEVGDIANPQRPAFSLSLMHPKWARVFASDAELARIRPGMTAEVTTDSNRNQPLQGKVGFISSVAEFTPKSVQTEEVRTSLVYEVRVVVDDAQDQLRLGQPISVRFVPGQAR